MGDFSALANRIKNLRQSLGMTQREFAKEAGCTAATLSAYENGSKSPSLEIVKGIAEAFDTSIDWLCGLSDKKTNDSEPQTYADVIKILLDIDTFMPFSIVNPDFSQRQLWSDSQAIVFDSSRMNTILADLRKFKDMLRNKTIDRDIYQACIEKLLRDNIFPLVPINNETSN